MDVSEFITPRQAIVNLAPYGSPSEGRADKTRLDFNENTVGFLDSLPDELKHLPPEILMMYPEYGRLTNQIADYLNVSPEEILLTNGSDEALCIIASTFIEPDVDCAVVSNPTFPMIPHYLQLAQARLVAVPVLKSLDFDLNALETALQNEQPKLAVFPSPDNPTGAILSLNTVERWCEQFPKTLFVLDEAYIEYGQSSVLPLLNKVANLLVTRTFSKAWGMAGLRLGVIIGPEVYINYLRRVRSPFSVNAMTVYVAEKMLNNRQLIEQQAAETIARKERVIAAIESRGYPVRFGHGNFFLLGMGIEAPMFSAYCQAQGVLIRDRSSLAGMAGLIRISIGTDAEMDQLLNCLESYQQQHALIFDLDDTLVDTSKSYDATVAHLYQRYANVPLDMAELQALRAAGGFNDDWDATVALLAKRGITVSNLQMTTEGKTHYLSIASAVEALWLTDETIKRLKTRYKMIIVTGRPRDEYTAVWEDRLAGWFDAVYCQDDFLNTPRKPCPDLLLKAMAQSGISGGIYIGNAVDDMQAAIGAGLIPVGVATNQSAETLFAAGAQTVLQSVNDLHRVLML